MKNNEIIGILKKISILMNIRNVNSFKIRAYDRVIRTLKDFNGSIEGLVAENQIKSIQGIGKGIADVITEIVETGKSSALHDLLGDMSESIFEIVEIQGLGPKKVAFLYNELGIDSLEDLERAAKAGYITDLKGFGEKSVEKILKGIELRKHALTHKSIGIALPLARKIIREIKKGGNIINISEAGCVRRRTETAERLEIICSTNNGREVLDNFIAGSFVEEVKEKSVNKASVIAEDDFPVILNIVDEDKFFTSLFLATGSEKHIAKIKDLLTKNGFILEDDGTFHNTKGEIVSISSGEDLYEKAGIPFIPPEIRETGEEVEAALSGNLPVLVERGDLKGDLQMHSTYSDGAVSIRGMVEKAMKIGYSYIAITDHSQSLRIANGLDKTRIEQQHREIDELNREYEGRFKVFKAAEVDILSDGSLDYDDEILKSLDFVLISVHMGMNKPREQMTQRVLKAIHHHGVHCLAHPSGRLIGRRREFELDWEKILEAVKETGIAIEINSHPARLDLNDKRCKIAKDMGIPIFINTDAHSPGDMDLMEYGIDVARRAWLAKENIVNCLSTEDIEKWLVKRKIY